MKEKKVLTPPSKLIHLSERFHDGDWFKPRVPRTAAPGEDKKTKRVCFSSSISGAYRAIKDCCWYNVLYVHVPCDIDEIARCGKIFKPTSEQVYDVSETGEYWVKCEVRLKCIGVIRAWDDCHGNVRFRWLERFKEDFKDYAVTITIDDD